MNLKEVYDMLVVSVLSKHVAGEEGSINEVWKYRINTLIQAAINDLTKRFVIRENELLLSTTKGKDIYELIPANAVSSGNPNAFIIDSVDAPFTGDIISIFRVTDSKGRSLWLNTDVAVPVPSENIYGVYPSNYNFLGVNFLSFNTLKLHKNHDLGDVLVQYKAKAKPINFGINPEDCYIDLPDHFLQAIVYYVGSQFFNPMGAETIGNGMFNEGQNYAGMYQNEIQTLQNSIGSIASMGESTKFERGGWV